MLCYKKMDMLLIILRNIDGLKISRPNGRAGLGHQKSALLINRLQNLVALVVAFFVSESLLQINRICKLVTLSLCFIDEYKGTILHCNDVR